MGDTAVSHSKGSYVVRFADLDAAFASISGPAVVVTDRNVHEPWGWKIPESLQRIVVDPGEESKSIESFERVHRELARLGTTRNTTLVAFGGGVVGDLAGFVAATYMRGVPYVQIPTSLLAMVDSSVGGKVAIDLPEGKNLVGAFYPPDAVWIGIESLATLPDRHLTNGMAEVLKYGFIADPKLLDHVAKLEIDSVDDFAAIISRCVEIKAEICALDEFDRSGQRATLNFGHTIGHALESELEYKELLHGEAIAIGMVAEARIGEKLGYTEVDTAERIASKLADANLPTHHPLLDLHEKWLHRLLVDKKSNEGAIGMSLLTRIGECKLFPSIPLDAIRNALANA